MKTVRTIVALSVIALLASCAPQAADCCCKGMMKDGKQTCCQKSGKKGFCDKKAKAAKAAKAKAEAAKQ